MQAVDYEVVDEGLDELRQEHGVCRWRGDRKERMLVDPGMGAKGSAPLASRSARLSSSRAGRRWPRPSRKTC